MAILYSPWLYIADNFLYVQKIPIVTFVPGITAYNCKKQGKHKFNEQPPLFITFWTGDKHLYE